MVHNKQYSQATFIILFVSAMILPMGCYKPLLDQPSVLQKEAESIVLNAQISIMVLDNVGQPVPGADVTLANAAKCFQQQKATNIDGMALYDNLSEDSQYTLIIEASGYHSLVKSHLEVKSHRNINIKVIMSPNSSIEL